MKNNIVYLVIFSIIFTFSNCKTTEKTSNLKVYKDSLVLESSDNIQINVEKGKSFNHPTFVFWKEDMEGHFIETIFITKSYASGIFGHHMIGDTIWMPNEGSSFQPAALPYWTHKKGLIDGKYLVPTPEHPYVDAISGATPIEDFQINVKNNKSAKYRIYLELNQAWDWNNYWTNNKFPQSNAYKHSAQPSIIYAVTINENDSVYFMNPVGHGDPKGETENLFTDISSLTTAKDIFKTIRISIK